MATIGRSTATLIRVRRASPVTSIAETVGEVQSLVKLVRNARDDEREMLRSRLKQRIRLVVPSMRIVACLAGTGKRCPRIACIQMYFPNGGRSIFVSNASGYVARIEAVEPWCDLRQDYRWFEKLIAETVAEGRINRKSAVGIEFKVME